MSKKFAIFEAANVSEINFSEVLETSEQSLRYSVDQTKVLLKFIGDTPSFLEGKTLFSCEEIEPILASADWTPAL